LGTLFQEIPKEFEKEELLQVWRARVFLSEDCCQARVEMVGDLFQEILKVFPANLKQSQPKSQKPVSHPITLT